MNQYLYILTWTILFFVTSCVKKEIPPSPALEEPQIPDTIKPGSYFPAYPGSWWKYSHLGTVGIYIETDSVSKTYTLNSYCIEANPSGGCKKSSSHYVPFYFGTRSQFFVFRYFDKRYNEIRPYVANKPAVVGLRQFLSETTGTCSLPQEPIVVDYRSAGLEASQEFITFISKIKDSNSDSLIVATGKYINVQGVQNNYKGVNKISYREYKKNVGLIRYWVYDTVLHDTIINDKLLDYFINH